MEAIALPEAAIGSICGKFGVRELSLFGSALGPDFRPESDIDLLVEFLPEAHAGLLALASMQEELEKLLGRKVDLVPKAGLKSMIRNEILAKARILYAA